MGTYKAKINDGLMCTHLSGELDARLATDWVTEIEQQERSYGSALNRFHDVREVDAIHLSFDELWDFAQRRMEFYANAPPTHVVFFVSNPLNYGIARMYQALTDGTSVSIEVLYDIEACANFLGRSVETLQNVSVE